MQSGNRSKIACFVLVVFMLFAACITEAVAGLPSGTVRQLTTENYDAWHGDWSLDGMWVVYQRDKASGSGTDIYKIRWDGTRQTRLTTGYYCDSKPKFSPDGKKIVFQRNVNPEGDSKTIRHASEIWIMNADGTNQRRLVGFIPADPGVNSGGGAQWPFWVGGITKPLVAFWYGLDGHKGLWVVKQDGTGLRQLVAPSDFGENPHMYVDWSYLKSTKIVVSLKNDNSFGYGRHLASIDINTGALTWLTDPNASTCQSQQKISPYGSLIAYMDDTNNRGDIWTMAFNGSGQKRLTDSASHDDACYSTPTWHPFGMYIAYWSSEGQSNRKEKRIYLMTPDGKTKKVIMTDEHMFNSSVQPQLTFNSTGNRLLFKGRDTVTNKNQLYVIDLR